MSKTAQIQIFAFQNCNDSKPTVSIYKEGGKCPLLGLGQLMKKLICYLHCYNATIVLWQKSLPFKIHIANTIIPVDLI